MASFSIPLTGLESDSTALNTIANDLSNMNTTAYKAQSTQFSDLFYQELSSTGSGDPIQVGSGVQVSENETDFSQGSINTTGNDTDVALDGNGFFVINGGDGTYEYTRNGDFSLASNGDLQTSNGQSVMGYPATAGVVNTNAPPTAINIPTGSVQEPKATSTLSMTANLDSDSATDTQFPATITVYDSLGEPQTLTVNYEQTGTNTWSYSASLPASAYSTSGTNVVPSAITGTMSFNSDGELTSITPAGGTAETVGTATGDVSSINLSLTPTGSTMADGAAPMTIQWNLLGTNGTSTISQVDSTSAVSAYNQNGYTSGTYQSFSIGSDGTVSVSYSNGQTENVGQLALANVPNIQGLQLLGDSNYATTVASGTATIGASGTSGLGTVEDDALEASNVNISTEFSDLIIAQRAFEANAKSVTTFDTVTQDAINMVH